jgi:hypothetical protein
MNLFRSSRRKLSLGSGVPFKEKRQISSDVPGEVFYRIEDLTDKDTVTMVRIVALDSYSR